MNYLADQVTDPQTKTGQFVVEYDGKKYACRVVLNRARGAKQADVTWT